MKGNITPPKDYGKWERLIQALVQHWTARYGLEEVKQWYFEVWNEPNLEYFWSGTQAEYFKLYEVTTRAIKSVSSAFRVGGPATAGNGWVSETIDFATRNHVPLDFIATHDYGVKGIGFDENGVQQLYLVTEPGAIIDGVRGSRAQIKSSALPNLPLHYTEWSTSYSLRDPVHDSYISAPYILSKLKGTEGFAESLSYWTFTDIFEEGGPVPSPFHGGFGLLNFQGLRKPAFYAYQFLNRLGPDELVSNDSDSWACRTARGVQILFWNFSPPITNESNQKLFVRDLPSKDAGQVRISVAGVPPGTYQLNVYRVGYHVWQYTYFTSKNELFKELVDKGYYVKNEGGELPFEDAVVDLSNPEAVKWYQAKLANLLKMGVGAIKADFAEGAPLTGQYASGRTGWYEHNLYPLRYNKAVADITREVNGENIIWARSAWAGSQRYPIHWGGDAENTNSAMAAELRGGLSFGLSGFTFWSHDVGGFVERAPRDLYRRWLAWGVLTSHTRAHGAPPREPWEYDEALTEDFRRALGLKYSLMPYIIAQAKESSTRGFPMLRTLFFEYPNDPTSWTIDDEYMFGSNLLVAPMFDEAASRKVYLPPGAWIDYQTGKVYQGAQWHQITPGQIPVVLLVKDHSVLPHVKVAQSTSEMDWNNVELRVFSTDSSPVSGLFALPLGDLQTLRLDSRPSGFALRSDPLSGKVKWQINRAPAK